MNKTICVLLIIFCLSCGKSKDSEIDVCRPQEIAIANCIVEEFEKNPSRIMLDYQKQYCQRLYPINMCYYE